MSQNFRRPYDAGSIRNKPEDLEIRRLETIVPGAERSGIKDLAKSLAPSNAIYSAIRKVQAGDCFASGSQGHQQNPIVWLVFGGADAVML